MAGGRPPLADTPLHHKHRDTAGNDPPATTHRQQNPPAHGDNRPRALCREPQDLAACDRASAPIAGSDRPGDGGIQQQASSRQGPDSPPNRPESQFFFDGVSSTTTSGVYRTNSHLLVQAARIFAIPKTV